MRGLITKNCPEAPMGCGESPVQESRLDLLKRNQKQLQDQLAVVNDAIEALEKNPEILKIVDLLNRAL